MATNKKIATTDLDFDAIKANIKSYLQGQDTFTDYDFEGSSLSILLDVLAYNTHYNALYTNLAVNESFLDSASKRSSVVSRAKEIGYIPRSATCPTARVNITVSNPTSTPSFLTIPAYQPFTTTIDGVSYNFYNLDAAVTTLSGSSYTFENIDIKEGSPLEFRYTVSSGTRYIIPNENVDKQTIMVRVQENATSASFETFINQEDIVNLDAASKVFFIKEIEGKLLELEFGNGVIGKALEVGNVVTISYMTTNMDSANGARLFSYQGATLLGGNVVVTTVTPAIGGTTEEDIDSIRYNAPRSYTAQNRAVTTEDYKSIILTSYPEADTINVWGGEDNVPIDYGKVYISIKPKTKDYLTTTEKELLVSEILKSKNVVSISPIIVDPEYINLRINSTVYYNPKLTTRSLPQIKDIVISTIKDYNDDNLNSYDGVFKHSNLISNIDAAEDSIISNITTVKLHREIQPKYNTLYTYTLQIGNPIYHSGVPEQSILSTGFYIPGNDNIMYLEDMPESDEKTGHFRMFYYNNDIKTYVRDFGHINYDNGEIILTEFNISGIDLTEHSVFELMIAPQSYDVVSIRNQLVTIPEENINVNVIIDKLASGDKAGGSNYIFTSSRS